MGEHIVSRGLDILKVFGYVPNIPTPNKLKYELFSTVVGGKENADALLASYDKGKEMVNDLNQAKEDLDSLLKDPVEFSKRQSDIDHHKLLLNNLYGINITV